MQISNYENNINYTTRYQIDKLNKYNTNVSVYKKINFDTKNKCPNFCSNPLKTLKEFNKYVKAQRFSNWLIKYYKSDPKVKKTTF